MKESIMLTQQIQAVEDNLQTIIDTGETHRTLVPWYVFTNDSGYGELFPQINQAVSQQKNNGKLRVSLLSGTGGLLSLAPELSSVDLFLIFDNNHFVPEAMIQAVRTLRGSINEGDYQRKFSQTQAFQEMLQNGADPLEWYEVEKEALGQYHFLYSKERFIQAQNALGRKLITRSIGNFSHSGYVDSLAHVLQGQDAEIVHAHFTDVTDWHPEILNNLSSLPFCEDAAISWSTNQDRPDERPLAQLSIGLEAYIKDAGGRYTSTSYFQQYENNNHD